MEEEEEKQWTEQVEEAERVGRDRRQETRRREEGKVGRQSQREAGESQSQRVVGEEEVRGEGQGWGGSWMEKKPLGEQGVGGLD